jgi:hypothetical protein
VELANTVYALDATTIDLCLSMFPWAPFRSTKPAVKLHTLLDLRGSIPTFIHISDGVAAFVYGLHVKEAYPGFVAARVRVGTFVDALVTFFVILYLTRRWGWKVALASAVIGTAAAPMLFELPFDLIVMARTNPPLPTHPMPLALNVISKILCFAAAIMLFVCTADGGARST